MRQLFLFGLCLAVPVSLLPMWRYFVPWASAQILYPYGFSIEAIVAVSYSLIMLPYFLWAVAMGLWLIHICQTFAKSQ